MGKRRAVGTYLVLLTLGSLVLAIFNSCCDVDARKSSVHPQSYLLPGEHSLKRFEGRSDYRDEVYSYLIIQRNFFRTHEVYEKREGTRTVYDGSVTIMWQMSDSSFARSEFPMSLIRVAKKNSGTPHVTFEWDRSEYFSEKPTLNEIVEKCVRGVIIHSKGISWYEKLAFPLN